MDPDRNAAAQRLAEITGGTGEAVTVRQPDSPSLWRRARGRVAAAALGVAMAAGASQAEAFDRQAVESLGVEAGVHTLDTPAHAGPDYQPVDVTGISGAMSAAADRTPDTLGVSYPGRRHLSMSVESTTKGVGIHVGSEAQAWHDLSRDVCAVEYNPAYIDDQHRSMSWNEKSLYGQYMGAAICLHSALTEQPANALTGRVAQGVLAEALAEQAGSDTHQAVERGLENRASAHLAHAGEAAEVRKAGAVMRIADAIAADDKTAIRAMSYAELVTYADRTTQRALGVAERSGLADPGRDTAQALAAGELGLDAAAAGALEPSSARSALQMRDAMPERTWVDLVALEPTNGERQPEARADSGSGPERADPSAGNSDRSGDWIPESRLNNWSSVAWALNDARESGQTLGEAAPDLTPAQLDDWLAVETAKAQGHAIPTPAPQHAPAPEARYETQKVSLDELIEHLGLRGELPPEVQTEGESGSQRADPSKHAPEPDQRSDASAEPVSDTARLDLQEPDMAKRDLKESDTAKLDLQKPDTAKLDLKEPDVVQLTIQEPETREITLRPERAGRAAALMDHAAAGGAAPHPRATDPRAAELAPALAATSWPGNPATFDPEVTRHLYTQAPDWFPAMASAKEGHVEARADRLVRRDYAVALQNADRRNDRSAWDRLAGFAEGNKGLTEVLARSRAQAQQRAEGKRRDQGAER